MEQPKPLHRGRQPHRNSKGTAFRLFLYIRMFSCVMNTRHVLSLRNNYFREALRHKGIWTQTRDLSLGLCIPVSALNSNRPQYSVSISTDFVSFVCKSDVRLTLKCKSIFPKKRLYIIYFLIAIQIVILSVFAHYCSNSKFLSNFVVNLRNCTNRIKGSTMCCGSVKDYAQKRMQSLEDEVSRQ